METLKDKRESLEGEWYYLEKDIKEFIDKTLKKIKKEKKASEKVVADVIFFLGMCEGLDKATKIIKQKSGFYEDER